MDLAVTKKALSAVKFNIQELKHTILGKEATMSGLLTEQASAKSAAEHLHDALFSLRNMISLGLGLTWRLSSSRWTYRLMVIVLSKASDSKSVQIAAVIHSSCYKKSVPVPTHPLEMDMRITVSQSGPVESFQSECSCSLW